MVNDLARPDVRRALAAALRPPLPPTPFRHDPRVPPPGSVLRHGQGEDAVEVEVLRDGFRWRGKTYASLSRIAAEASGTAWNGFLYFNLARRRRRPPAWRRT
jgi:hypothetical protein